MALTVHSVIWVCECCLLAHANGECCSHEQHGGDGAEPLNRITDGYSISMGMGSEEHSEHCLQQQVGWSELPSGYECDCETDSYSTSQCEGCGSYLHGSRHAMTLFVTS